MTWNFLHIIKNYLGKIFLDDFFFKLIDSVCQNPTHMDAREVRTKISWIGSDSLLVYAHDHSVKSNSKWSYGLSKSFGEV